MSNIRIPTLRFREFEDDWTYKCLSQFAYRVTKKNTNLVEHLVLSNSAKFGVISQDDFFDKEIAKPDNLAGYSTVDVDDFIYNPRVSVYANFGPVNRNKLSIGVVSPLYTVFRITEGNLDFFEQYFKSTKWHRYIYKIANYGARAGRMSFKGGDFFNLPVPNIGELEQLKIADFLSSVDTRIEQLKRKRSLLEQYKKVMLQKIFSQEIRFKDEKGKDYPDWELRSLGSVGKFVSGVGFPHSEQGNKEGIPFYKVSDMNLKGNEIEMGFSSNYVTKTQIKKLKYKPIYEGAIIFAKVGAAVFLERKRLASRFLIDNNMMAFIPDSNLVFLKHVFNKIKLSKYVQVGALPSYSQRDLATVRIALPVSEVEQQKIADFLSSIDKMLELISGQILKTSEFKNGLLQQMLV